MPENLIPFSEKKGKTIEIERKEGIIHEIQSVTLQKRSGLTVTMQQMAFKSIPNLHQSNYLWPDDVYVRLDRCILLQMACHESRSEREREKVRGQKNFLHVTLKKPPKIIEIIEKSTGFFVGVCLISSFR